MIGTCNDSTQPFAKTICSICYEDLKPSVEDLQAISICGHVFHELCIQQWFEYCSKGKKKCPICKQTCSASNVSRLYFQSVGDSNDPNLSQKLQTHNADPEELKLEVRKLEGKINGLRLVLESREKAFINLKDDYSVCKEQLKEEASLKNEAMGQTRTINSLYESKTKELKDSEQERDKLEKRNMALVKELAAIKLAYGLGLEHDKIVKLASLGTERHSKDSVDTLVKALAVRQKTYEELIIKYKTLGGDDALSRKEGEMDKKNKVLENLKEKTNQMKTAKASKKMKDSPSVPSGVNTTLNDTCTPQDTIKEPDGHFRQTKRLRATENYLKSNNKDGVSFYISSDDEDDAPTVSISPEIPSYDSVPQPTKRATTDDDMAFAYETGQDKPLPNITKGAPLPVLGSQQAEFCFSAALLDPNRTNSSLGRLCKRGQNKGSNFSSVSTQLSGNLINVGPDGRGGTKKVLNSLNRPSNDSRGSSSSSANNSKLRAKTSSLQSQGSLTINHFFNKAGQ